MISTESFLKVKEDIQILKWSTGSSITLKYKLFCTKNCKLFLSIEKKIHQQQRSLEKVNWFKQHPICELQIDEIGYFGYILTETGYLFRIPLGIFGIQDAKEDWNYQILNNPEIILQNYKQTWELVPKLKEIQITRLVDLNYHNVLNPITKKHSQLQDQQLAQFSYLTVWRANDNKQYAIIATKGCVILFISLDTCQLSLALNLEVDELKKVRLIETQSLSYLLVQYGYQDEYIQISLQKNVKEDKEDNQNNKKAKGNREFKNLLNSYKSQQFLNEMISIIGNNGFQFFISEEDGAIRIFFYCYKTKILKIYRPGNLSSSKYRFFIQLENIIEIIQWKNYYVIFQKDILHTKVDFFLKVTLQKCEKKILEAPNFRPIFPKPVFSYTLYDQKIEVNQIIISRNIYQLILSFYHQKQILKIDPLIQLSDRTFSTDIYKTNGIETLFLDLNHGKLELENQIHSDNFQINTYLYYEMFLKNHQYDIEFCINNLHQSLKSQQKWENLCLIDLQNKDKDPFKLFHQYSSIKSARMGIIKLFYYIKNNKLIYFQILEYLLFKSLLTAYDKVEILDENIFNGFVLNIILGVYGVKMSSFDIQEFPKFKQMSNILQEQSLSPYSIVQYIYNQKLFSSANNEFQSFLKNLTEEEDQFNMRYNKKLIDFQELNLIFRQKRYAELVLNIICIISSVSIDKYQRERLQLDDLLQVVMIDDYWINEFHLMHILQKQYEIQSCPNFLRCIYLIMLYSQKEGFHQELNYYLQKLNQEELFKLLNIFIRNFKVMYQNKPFLNQNCISLLLTKFYSLQLNQKTIKEFIDKSLVQSTAESNFKDVNHNDLSTYFNLIQKIYKQKSKLAQGSYTKYLFGIDAVWLILQQIEKSLKEQLQIGNHNHNNNIQDQNVLKATDQNYYNQKSQASKSLSPVRKNKGIKEQIQQNEQLDYIVINNLQLVISQPENLKNYQRSPHFTFQKKELIFQNNSFDKENSYRSRSESIQDNNQIIPNSLQNISPRNTSNDNTNNVYLKTLLNQIDECLQQIQKITSTKVKKVIYPNQQISSLLSQLK